MGAQRQQASMAHDVAMLAAKLALVAAAALVLLTFVFGLDRVEDEGMSPGIKQGDLLVFYRLDRSFVASEVVVVEYEDSLLAGRVIAKGGDVVNIDSEGLRVNGAYQQEHGIIVETTQVAGGVTFPLTVPEGSLFILGDNRTAAVDSRIYGCVPEDDVRGKVFAQFRRRGF